MKPLDVLYYNIKKKSKIYKSNLAHIGLKSSKPVIVEQGKSRYRSDVGQITCHFGFASADNFLMGFYG